MPPKLPPDALTPPPASARDAMPSPFDDEVVSSAPPPTPARGALKPSMWMDRSRFPLVKPEHTEELEQLAAVNEFGRRMPREKAEAEAYAHYRDRQHNEAAIHHLRGQRIAQAAGDLESARKHSLMYGLHTKALGREPIGPVHPDVKSGLAEAPSRMYRYKPHGGDMLALAPHVTEHGAVASAPAPQPAQLGKAEVDALLVLRQACEVLSKGVPPSKGQKDRARMKDVTGEGKCPHCGETVKTRGNIMVQHTRKRYLGTGMSGGMPVHVKEKCKGSHESCEESTEKGELSKGDVVQFPGNPAPAEDKGAEAPVTAIGGDPREKRKVGGAYGFNKYDYSDHLPPEHQRRGMKLFVFHDPQRGNIHGSLVNSGGAIVATHERLGPEKYRATGAQLNPATQDAIANAIDAHLGENGFDAKPRPQGATTGQPVESTGATDELLAHHAAGRSLDNHDDREAVRQHLVEHHGLNPRTARQLVSRHEHLSLDDPEDRHFFASAIDREKGGDLGKKEKDDEEMESKSKRSREDNATTCPDCGKYKPYWAQRCLGCYKEREGLGKAEGKGRHDFLARTNSPVADCKHCGRPRKDPVHTQEPVTETWETKARRDNDKTQWNKAEFPAGEKLPIHKGDVCRCDAYKFPHRAGSHPSKPCK